ncbi:UPF0481 protein At3g47200-like [Humulus lupulus]|uniref:UPF0481 protein At3g47200-like n=1 Tax=Humulus lupulus TaxID=3486 RepID=UPI002B415758|nr:UPF0481 protein At3g47200-like [Humulus lupulus]
MSKETAQNKNAVNYIEKVESKINEIDQERDEKVKEKEGSNKAPNPHDQKPKIQKAPMVLRDRQNYLDKYFKPRVVSIGPIHHGDKKVKQWEKYKTRLAAKFIESSSSPNNKTTLSFFDTIKGNISELKELFDEEMDQLVVVIHDLFFLENQIPLRVLELLINNLDDGAQKNDLMNSIKTFIVNNVMAPNEYCQEILGEEATRAIFEENNLLKSTQLLELLQKQEKSQSFRNVEELKAAWISVEPSKKCWPLKQVRFIPWSKRELYSCYKFKPVLELPRLMVDDSMGAKFMNLIAYEMCPDNFRTQYEVTSYICFWDSLIDNQSDVKALRSKKILVNHLGSDQEVTDMFNEIANDLVPSPYMYKNVKNDIQRLYNMKCMTWLAEAYSNHFSSPWTTMAFLGTVVALFLSGVQTWYTIYPVE